jgi:hypothetical protein
VNDRLIVEYLRGRAAVEPPIGLVGAIAAEVSGTPQEQRHRLAAYLPVAAAVAVVAVAAAFVVGTQPDTTQPPTAASLSPSPSPSSSPIATPTSFIPDYDSFAEVAQSGLVLYDGQDPASATTVEVYEGQRIYVTERPSAPGWRRIQAGDVFGWIRLEVGGRATLRPAELRCPTKMDVSSLAALSPPERVKCSPSSKLELRGWAQSFEPDTGHAGAPTWLAGPSTVGILAGTPSRFRALLDVSLDPSANLDFPNGEKVVAVGHFRDERSATCRRTPPSGFPSETPEESMLWCTQQFVVDEVRRVGPPIPMPAPVTYRDDPGSPFTVIDNAEADALFSRIDTCTNPDGQFTVNFPADWYTNPTIGDLPACSWFAPRPFAISDISVVPDEIAIVVHTFEGGFGYVYAPKTTIRDDITIGGHEGYRFEQVGVSYEGGGFEALPPSYTYNASFGSPISEGPSMQAVTESEGASDYILNKAVLDRIMASLVFLGRS